jgi:hypothetical protein
MFIMLMVKNDNTQIPLEFHIDETTNKKQTNEMLFEVMNTPLMDEERVEYSHDDLKQVMDSPLSEEERVTYSEEEINEVIDIN